MRKSIFAAATATMLVFGLVAPASASDKDESRKVPLGSSGDQFEYTFEWNEDKPWRVEESVVKDPEGNPVCSSENPGGNDFMFTVSNGRCHYRTPLEVIKEITNYINSISSVITSLVGIMNNATRFMQ